VPIASDALNYLKYKDVLGDLLASLNFAVLPIGQQVCSIRPAEWRPAAGGSIRALVEEAQSGHSFCARREHGIESPSSEL
jgi:hypothetical protein